MNKTLMRFLSIALLMMVSIGAWADVKVLYGEKGLELEAIYGTITIGQKEGLTGGTILIAQEDQDGTCKVTISVTPSDGYTLAKDSLEVYAVAPADINSTRAITASDKLNLVSDDFKDISSKRTYTATIDSNLALWVKSASFQPRKREGAKGPVTYTYYALHANGKGYMKQCKGVVYNDNTFRYENAYDGNGSSMWVYSSEGYLQQDMYYLNVINGKTLVLSTTPETKWELVDDGTKKRFQMEGSTKILGYNSGSYPILDENPTNKYAACTLTVTEEGSKWEGPKDVSFTVQSPQLVTYLRTYYLRNITVTIDKNDAGTENAKVVDKKDSRCYCSLTYKSTTNSDYDSKWRINTTTGVIYNTTTGQVKNVDATYEVAPLNPIVKAAHPATDQTVTLTLNAKSLAPSDTKKYLLFNTQDDNYRFLKATTSLSEDDLLPVNGKKAELTETVNEELAWDVEVDDEGYYSFKNVATGRYFYYDATDYTVSDYGAVKIGSTDPGTDTRYKFRLYGCGNRDPFGGCQYIIPFEKQFAVFKSGGTVEELPFALYMNTSNSTKIASIVKAGDNAKWKLYTYEWQYRLWSNYTIDGEQEVYADGEHNYTATTWFSRNIKDSPTNSEYCLLPGSKTKEGITYTWELTGLDDYVTTTNALSNGTSTLTATVTLPPGTRTGTLKVTARITTPANINNNTSILIALYNLSPTFTEISSLSAITDATGLYKLTADVSYTTPEVTTFSGTLDGDGHTISGLSAPLFNTLDGATVRNLFFDNVSISSGTNVGAVCGEATGTTRIYNCGILATNSTVITDEDGYTHIETNSSTVSGSKYVGGLVGLLDGEARVINCFSYADITGGTNVGGIVGYNNVATTSQNLKTMVMNCMFYGDITGGTNKAPVYNGKIITNRGDQNGVSNFNYFRAEASYVQKRDANQNPDIQTYNCALIAETRFLQRFEFFRHLLNSHRELAAWWATGSTANKDEMMKWVLEPEQIGTSTPYPILKTPGRYRSVTYIDDLQINKTAKTGSSISTGTSIKTLTVKIQMGSGNTLFTPAKPADAEIVVDKLTLNITDKDPGHFNFNYGKVQLPYYNDVGTKNYTSNRVVTGWKIVSMDKTSGSFTTEVFDATADITTENGETKVTLTTPYNFADRACTAKDIYSNDNKRVFNQGAYFDVPEGVTTITIEPYWAKAAYVADDYRDVVYNTDMGNSYSVSTVAGGQWFTDNSDITIDGSSQKIRNTIANAKGSLGINKLHTVYDYAVVLVGNVHAVGISSTSTDEPYTITSVDLDHDNEPDYSYILRFNGRVGVHPVRVDFLNIPGLGMAQKSTGGTGSYNFGIMQPRGWFESTNTALFRVTQLEYDVSGRAMNPMILHGGVIEQWVTYAQGNATTGANKVSYYHVGGNVWFKEFHIGAHQDRTNGNAPHPPVSVTGGDYEVFYLTGLFTSPNTNIDDNAECYINGGRFGIVAGTGNEGIGHPTNHTNGNIVWQIDNADINEFYGGGINAGHIAEGNITTVIRNSYVHQFCGGPEFGDMNIGRTVTTKAENCVFDTYFGAGFGGSSYNKFYPKNKTGLTNTDWNSWLTNGYTNEGIVFDGYKNAYIAARKGVEASVDYQFLPESNNTKNVARLIINYVSFSLATTHSVISELKGCTINNNFYGGGSLGKVEGSVSSILKDCTIYGNVFGAGYSASLPTVEVMNTNGFQTEPHYVGDLGAFLPAVPPATDTYTWEHAETVNSDNTAINTRTKKLFTTVNLEKSNLGSVAGSVSLTIDGTSDKGSTITGNVYGGGEQSYVTGADNTVTVTLKGKTTVNGSVYGGGDQGVVEGSATVNIEQ